MIKIKDFWDCIDLPRFEVVFIDYESERYFSAIINHMPFDCFQRMADYKEGFRLDRLVLDGVTRATENGNTITRFCFIEE